MIWEIPLTLVGGAELSQQIVINARSRKVSDDSSKETRDGGYNLATVGHYTILGGGLFAPVCHYWYQWLDTRLPGTAAAVVARKVAVDIALFALPYYTLFYIAINCMARVPLEHSVTELKQKLVPTIITTTAFWVPAQAVNFRWSPVSYKHFSL